MALNEDRHHDSWEANADAIQADYETQAKAEGYPDLLEHSKLHGLMRNALKETVYLLNEATDDDEFLEALNQRTEVARLYLQSYRSRRIA